MGGKAFQSTPSYEGEQLVCKLLEKAFEFQSTPSYEGELHLSFIFYKRQEFQSTPSYEGEPLLGGNSLINDYFNPLPHTRENLAASDINTTSTISIHSLIRGRTIRLIYLFRAQIFQSTPSYEGEHELAHIYLGHLKFQSTPSYEGEQLAIDEDIKIIDISIHSLIRGRTA